jgi:hypothetical protein
MHLSTCTNTNAEEILSRSLLDDVFKLRVSRILAGSILADKVRFRGERSGNTRYSMLVELRATVWKRLGWDRDGKGKDPWGGRLDPGLEGEAAVAEDGHEEHTTSTAAVNIEHIHAAEGFQMDIIDKSMMEDPLNMFNWDEWEGLTEGLFVS